MEAFFKEFGILILAATAATGIFVFARYVYRRTWKDLPPKDKEQMLSYPYITAEEFWYRQ